MNHPTHERLLRLLQGELTPGEEAQVRQELARSSALRAELEEIRALQGLLQTTVRASTEDALRPFFADRVMRRLRPAAQRLADSASEEEFFGVLLRLFRPVALAGLLIILGFAAYNVTQSDGYESQPSTTEAVLGLPPMTLATAYEFDLSPTTPTDP
ncbi:MAG: hypothetical protein ACE5G0_06075 [Rhodothermales bacterium]